MIYQSTPLISNLKSPMQILQSRSATSDLLMSNAARQQLGLQSEDLRKADKHEHVPTHDYLYWSRCDVLRCDKQLLVSSHYNKLVSRAMKLQPLLPEKLLITEGTQTHLKPYQPQSKKLEA